MVVLCLGFAAGAVYLNHKPISDMVQYYTLLKYNGESMYYEKEYLTRIDDLMLKLKKGDKIAELSGSGTDWYKLKNSDDMEHLIQYDGSEYTKWKFVKIIEE